MKRLWVRVSSEAAHERQHGVGACRRVALRGALWLRLARRQLVRAPQVHRVVRRADAPPDASRDGLEARGRGRIRPPLGLEFG